MCNAPIESDLRAAMRVEVLSPHLEWSEEMAKCLRERRQLLRWQQLTGSAIYACDVNCEMCHKTV